MLVKKLDFEVLNAGLNILDKVLKVLISFTFKLGFYFSDRSHTNTLKLNYCFSVLLRGLKNISDNNLVGNRL